MGYKPNLILSSRIINNGMSAFIAKKTIRFLVDYDKNIKGSKILVLGLTFKENCPDIRNTKVLDIIDELEDYGCCVDIYDPWVDDSDLKSICNKQLISNPFESTAKYDAILVCVSHHQFVDLNSDDYNSISNDKPIVIDIKGIVNEPTWRL